MWTCEQLDQAFRRVRHRRADQPARHTFGVFLQSVGRLAPRREHGPHASVLAAYRSYLSEVRGLAPATIIQHMSEASLLVRHALPEGESLKQLTAQIIEGHIEHRARAVSRRTLRTNLGSLRVFLRYCFDRRLITIRLDVMDQPAGFRDELPPRALDWSLIQEFLGSIDRTDRGGWRDFMMLHLMAHYGLRPGEVARLRVESIDWTARTLLVEQPKTHSWLTLPLMDDTVDLLGRYLRAERRHHRQGELFSCVAAPYGPMSKASVSKMFKNRARKSGLPITHASPYALRHSFAMRLFARNVGIKVIGDLMGHHCLASTTVYLRLQTDVLREVALPVPALAELQGGAA
jgi:integrase